MTSMAPIALALLAGCSAPPRTEPGAEARVDARDAVLQAGATRVTAGRLTLRAGGAGLASLLGAAPGDAPRPVELDVRADRVTIDARRREARFEGNVRLSRDEVELSCDRLVAETDDASRLRRARAEGNVRVVVAGSRVTAPEADLDLSAGVLRFARGAAVERAGARIEGASVEVRLDGGQVLLLRARGTFRL
jgi:lipopolysaccharide transport protein LptA